MSPSVRLGPNHGYRFEGDKAYLNAELAIAKRDELSAQSWALQLWACEAPYQGGPLRGIKVAEAALSLDGEAERLEAGAIAKLPPVQRDYAMVLVLASGERGACDQVHDFSNYPARQVFAGPHLDGSVGYRFDGEQAVLQCGVVNARDASNLSGTLALELWALREPYQGGELLGTCLAHVDLGCLRGQQQHTSEHRAPRNEPASGVWQLTMVLREWTCGGYQTRDYCNFPVPYGVEPSQPAVRIVEPPRAVGVEALPSAAPEALPSAAPEAVPSAAPEPARESVPASVQPRLALKVIPKGPGVSISHASVQELAAVNGLNAKLAQQIVRARPFASLGDLTRVRGIGDKLLAKLRSELTL
ncbi:MAG TPA: helix-hairpin-helix domain-containing protein [Polyangiales bacterium]